MNARRPDRRADRIREAKARLAEATKIIDCQCGRRHAISWAGCDEPRPVEVIE